MNEPLAGSRLLLMTLGLGLGTFAVALDGAVANVAITSIAGDLAVSPNQGTWAITSFTAANAITLPLTGVLARRFGEVRLFVVATALFTLASILCALAPGLTALVLARIFQGAVAGPMLPLSQSLLLQNFPARLRGMALAVVSMTVTIAPLTGPIVGGTITDNWTWPWIFLINVPIGLAAAALVWSTLRRRETARSTPRFDAVGLVLLVVWVGCLQVLLDKGQEVDWFAAPLAIGLGISALVGAAYFVVWELTSPHPLVNLRLYGNRNFFIGTLATALPWSVLFSGLVVFPLWLQTSMGYTATWAGVATASFGVFIMLLTPIVGRLLTRLNLKYVLTVSFSLLWLGTYLASRMNTDATLWDMALPRLIQGAGLGLFFVPLLTIALSNIPPAGLASATGVFYFTRTLAGSIGVSVGIAVWDRREVFHYARLADWSGEGAMARLLRQGVEGFGSLGAGGLDRMEHLLWRQANMLAANDVYFAASCLLPPILLLIWLARPPFVPGGRRAP